MTEENTPLWARDGEKSTTVREANLGEMLIMTSFVIFCVRFAFDYSDLLTRINLLNTVFVALNIVLPLIKIILLQRYLLIRLILTTVIALLIGYSSIISVNNHFLTGFLILLAMQDVDLDKIVRLGFRLKVASIVIHLIIYIFMFIIDSSVIQFVYRAGTGAARHYFFMGHANSFSAFLLWACLDYIFLNYKRLKLYHVAIIWIITLFFNLFTDSNTAWVVTALITILLALDKLGKGFFDKLLTFLAKYTYPICAAVFSFLVIVFTYLNPVLRDAWLELDNTLTGRLWFGAYVYDTYGVTLLGRTIRHPPVIYWQDVYFSRMVFLDSHYLANLLRFGIINLITTAFVFIFFGGKMESREKLIIIAFSVFAIMQNDVTNIVVCFAMLIIGKYIYLDELQGETAVEQSP